MRARLFLWSVRSLVAAVLCLPLWLGYVYAEGEPAPPDLVEVVATGMGIDANAALLNAYTNAVQQALGLYVDAETMVQNDQIVRDDILTYSKGFIAESTQVSSSQENGLFQVTIRAKVKREELLEQAKTSNISLKAVEGASLHAQVVTQTQQEQDGKALLEKALQPLMDTSLLRAEVVPPTEQQPNPVIGKSEDGSVTLGYTVHVWIDKSAYMQHIKNNLLPVLNQIAVRKGEYVSAYFHVENDPGQMDSEQVRVVFDAEKEYVVKVLTWVDRLITSSKWQWFVIAGDTIPAGLFTMPCDSISEEVLRILANKTLELSLLDDAGETIALNSLLISPSNQSYKALAAMSLICINNAGMFKISPHFTYYASEREMYRDIQV